jgi:lactate racemase
MIIGTGFKDRFLSEKEMAEVITRGLASLNLAGKSVLVITPDGSRTCPLPFLFRTIYNNLAGKVKKQEYLIALGTHPPMEEAKINKLFGITANQRWEDFRGASICNHRWDSPKALKHIGTISADEIEKLSSGLMREEVKVECNKMIFDFDQIIIVGPTFPHEVVGFSGGNKYFFPGVSGPEVLNFFHWLGAVITNPVINGTKYTPVRKVVNKAASLITVPKACFSLVTFHEGVKGIFFGSPEEAWDKAADLSSQVHVIYKPKPFKRVLSMAPEMYEDIWTAGKCMYKLEPVVADGGELIIYAPHVTEVSHTHGEHLDKIGYHVRDYFRKQMDKFKDIPRGVLAHSTHVKGIGRFENGVETPRINVVLATSIPEERCKRINLGYRDWKTIKPEEWMNRENEGVLCVPRAGEYLYRLADGSVPKID